MQDKLANEDWKKCSYTKNLFFSELGNRQNIDGLKNQEVNSVAVGTKVEKKSVVMDQVYKFTKS